MMYSFLNPHYSHGELLLVFAQLDKGGHLTLRALCYIHSFVHKYAFRRSQNYNILI